MLDFSMNSLSNSFCFTSRTYFLRARRKASKTRYMFLCGNIRPLSVVCMSLYPIMSNRSNESWATLSSSSCKYSHLSSYTDRVKISSLNLSFQLIQAATHGNKIELDRLLKSGVNKEGTNVVRVSFPCHQIFILHALCFHGRSNSHFTLFSYTLSIFA